MVNDVVVTGNGRVVPMLLIDSRRCIKTTRYGRRTRYIGDLLNILRIFSDKCVDEIVICDRGAARRGIDIELLSAASSEFFAPITYGGGVRSASDAERVVGCGVEKVLVTSAAPDAGVIEDLASRLGSQSVVVGLDVVRRFGRRHVAIDGARRVVQGGVIDHAVRAAERGAGELMVNATYREGTGRGYDLALARKVVRAVSIPVTVCGGAGTAADFARAFETGAEAAAAGTLFMFLGPFQAVLPTYFRTEP